MVKAKEEKVMQDVELVENSQPTEEVTTAVAVVEEEELSGDFSLEDLGFTADEIAELSGLDNIDGSEISIPYATLIQKPNREIKQGDIIFPDGTVLKGISEGEVLTDIAILKVQPVRVYFPTPFNPKNSYVCRSLDGKTGAVDGVSQYPEQPCNSCVFAQYPKEGGASPCRDQRLLLCALPDGSLFHFQIGGIAMKSWRTFMSAQIMPALPKVARKLKGQVMGALRIDLSVKEETTDFGQFAVPHFSVNKQKPMHDMAFLSEILNSYKAYRMFETEHIKTAATETKLQMATSEVELEGGSGENKEMF